MGQILRQRSSHSGEFELKSVQVTSPQHAKRPPNTPPPPSYTTPRQRYNRKSQQYYCCVSVSAFFIITGAILILQSDITRARKRVTEPYEEKVNIWNKKYKQQFQNTKWRLQISPGKNLVSNEKNTEKQKTNLRNSDNFKVQEKNQQKNQKADTSEYFFNETIIIPLTVQNFEKQVLENTQFYEQIKFKSEDSLFRAIFINQSVEQNNNNNAEFKSGSLKDSDSNKNYPNKDDYVAISQSMQQFFELELQFQLEDENWSGINLGELQIFQRKEARMASWKSCQFREGGRWLKGACITYKQIDQLCYIVSENSSQQYALDSQYGGIGCASGRSWLPYHLHRVRVAPRGMEVARIPAQQMNTPQLTVMHVQDPELFARNVTQGNFVVAETNLEMYSAGMTLLLFGSALALPLLILAVMWIIKKSQKIRGKYQYFSESDDDDDSDY